MGHFDLDAARAGRAARREASGERHSFTFQGRKWALPAELPASFLIDIAALTKGELERLKPLLASVLGDQLDDFLDLEGSADDLLELMWALPDLYELSMGEASASAAFSRSSGRTSRPTSPAFTASTFPRPSGDPIP